MAAMSRRSTPRTPPPPLDATSLRALALFYVGRYATTTTRLRRYLQTRLRTRGWQGAVPPALDALIAQIVKLGYVDDRAFGETRARGLASKGYGARRVAQDLRASGISADDITEITAASDAAAAAQRYAQRRRFGRWDPQPADPLRARRQFAAMVRAGHAPEAIRAALGAVAGDCDDDL
jgi:regulatory protein